MPDSDWSILHKLGIATYGLSFPRILSKVWPIKYPLQDMIGESDQFIAD